MRGSRNPKRYGRLKVRKDAAGSAPLRHRTAGNVGIGYGLTIPYVNPVGRRSPRGSGRAGFDRSKGDSTSSRSAYWRSRSRTCSLSDDLDDFASGVRGPVLLGGGGMVFAPAACARR